MKVLVALKSVPFDETLPVAGTENASPRDGEGGALVIDAGGKAALEAAFQIRRQVEEAKIIAATVGEEAFALYHALARGADRAILLRASGSTLDARATALALSRCVSREQPELVLCGAFSSDFASGCLAGFLAERLGVPQVTEAVGIEVSAEARRVRVLRRVDGGARKVIESGLPAVVSVDRAIAEARYASVNACLLARTREIEVVDIDPASLRQDCSGGTRILKVEQPRPRPKRAEAPDSSLSPLERMKFVTGQAGNKRGKSKLCRGSPDQLAEEIFRFLQEEGLLPTRGSSRG